MHWKGRFVLYRSIAVAGAAVNWLRDNLGIISNYSEVSEFASKVENNSGVYFVPAFSGLFAPYWISEAKGCIVGITQYTNKNHICRATLESVCFQTSDIIRAIEKDGGFIVKELCVDGGLTKSDLAMQMQADIAKVTVRRPLLSEATAYGAALASAHGIGLVDATSFTRDSVFDDFHPRNENYSLEDWKRAITAATAFIK
jgi:glycerol kinase